MTFAARMAAERPGQVALRAPDGDWTWAQVDTALRPTVAGLQMVPWRPARRVAIYAEDSGATLLHYAAATLAGCSAVAVNFHLTSEDTAAVLTDSQADLLIVDDATAERGVHAARLAQVPAVVGGSGLVAGSISLTKAAAYVGDAEPSTALPPRPAVIYTSGTTGTGPGVELPSTGWAGGSGIDEHLERLAQESMVAHGRHLIVGPMYHSGPITGTRLFLGGAAVTVLGRFDAENFLATIERDRIGSTIVMTPHLQRVMALPVDVRNRYDLSSVRFLLQVGARPPEPDERATIEWLASRGVGDILREPAGGSELGTTCKAGPQ